MFYVEVRWVCAPLTENLKLCFLLCLLDLSSTLSPLFTPLYPFLYMSSGAVVAVDSKQKLSLDTSVDSVPKWLALETVLLFPVIAIALNSRLAKKVLILNLQSNR